MGLVVRGGVLLARTFCIDGEGMEGGKAGGRGGDEWLGGKRRGGRGLLRTRSFRSYIMVVLRSFPRTGGVSAYPLGVDLLIKSQL